MKNLFTKIVVLLFFMLSFNISAQVDTLTILHFNDTHSCLAPLAPRASNLEGTRGGIARAATLIGMTKMSDPNVLVLHGGDSFIGNLFFNKYYGAAELQLLNQIGVDAMAIGNHEFDLTPAILDTALKIAFPSGGFPLLSANLILDDPAVQSLKNYIKPFVIKQLGNIKVGLFGMITPETNYFSQPYPAVIDTSQANLMQYAVDAIDSLKANKCNVIICLSHLGFNADQMLASYIPGIDVIVGAHDHLLLQEPVEVINPEGKNTLIVQADAFYSNVGKLKLILENGSISKFDYQMIALDENISEEPTVKAAVNGLITDIESLYGPVYTQQIAIAANNFEEVADITGSGPYDTPVGNLVTDAFRWKTNTDIAIEAGGSTAQKLYKGPIVAADVFMMLGYGFNETNGLGFRIVKFNITGANLWAGLESVISQVQNNDELLPQVSGMSYSFNLKEQIGQKIKSVSIGGVPLDPEKTYSVTANEFLVQALTSSMFNIPISDVYLYQDSSEFQVVSEFIALKGTVDPIDFKRSDITGIRQIKNNIAKQFSLDQNYPNPFNPTTFVSFVIGHQSFVTLKVYDVLGREAATIVNEEKSAGKYTVEFNASNLSSGVYFYRMEASDAKGSAKFIETKKLILLK